MDELHRTTVHEALAVDSTRVASILAAMIVETGESAIPAAVRGKGVAPTTDATPTIGVAPTTDAVRTNGVASTIDLARPIAVPPLIDAVATRGAIVVTALGSSGTAFPVVGALTGATRATGSVAMIGVLPRRRVSAVSGVTMGIEQTTAVGTTAMAPATAVVGAAVAIAASSATAAREGPGSHVTDSAMSVGATVHRMGVVTSVRAPALMVAASVDAVIAVTVRATGRPETGPASTAIGTTGSAIGGARVVTVTRAVTIATAVTMLDAVAHLAVSVAAIVANMARGMSGIARTVWARAAASVAIAARVVTGAIADPAAPVAVATDAEAIRAGGSMKLPS